MMAEKPSGWKARFFTIWTGQQLSFIGSEAAQFALVWWLTTNTGSATVLATATLVALLPRIVLGPFIGALIDRWNRRLVMLTADTFIALLALCLAYLFWAGALQVWHIYVVMLARSLGEAFHWPAMASSTTLMVPEQHLARVAGLNQSMHGVMSIVGPPLGALLMALLPLHGVMMVDVGTALFAILPLLFIFVPQPEKAHVDALRQASVFVNMRDGLRYVLHWPGMLALLAGVFIIKIALQPALSLVPLLVYDHFGGSAADLSLIEAIAGVGILGGGLILSVWGGFRRKVYTVLMGLVGIGVAAVLLGVTPAHIFWMALVAAFFLGAMISMTDGPTSAIFQATVPAQMQGRVFGLLGSLFSLSTPVGLAIAGPVSDLLGVRFWFQLGGLLCIVVGVVNFFIPAVLRLEDHRPLSDEKLEEVPATESLSEKVLND
jgi:DHA3 family macrolide efflux protein-like MFS transporter